MNTALKILVLLFLPLCITALVLGNMLFAKREILKGRTQKLEQTLMKLSTTIEEVPAEASAADYPARDISPTAAELVPNPELSKFWSERYSNSLEKIDLPTMKLSAKENELKAYYKIDPVTLKPEKDLASGAFIPGPMNPLLADLLEKASDQYTRLNVTRQMLTLTREELVDTIKELNQKKGELRQALKTIEELKAEIEKLKAEIESLKAKIVELNTEIEGLKGQIAEKDKEIEQLKEEKETQKKKYDDLMVRYKKLVGDMNQRDGSTGEKKTAANLKQGPKGTVSAVNPQYNFVVIELTDEFITELYTNDEAAQQVTPADIELTISRPGKPEKFVTKVRMVQIRKDQKKGVADVLVDWQQMPLEKGDKVYFY